MSKSHCAEQKLPEALPLAKDTSSVITDIRSRKLSRSDRDTYLGHANPLIRKEVAMHQDLSADQTERALNDDDHEVRVAALSSQEFDVERATCLLDKAISSNDFDAMWALLENDRAPLPHDRLEAIREDWDGADGGGIRIAAEWRVGNDRARLLERSKIRKFVNEHRLAYFAKIAHLRPSDYGMQDIPRVLQIQAFSRIVLFQDFKGSGEHCGANHERLQRTAHDLGVDADEILYAGATYLRDLYCLQRSKSNYGLRIAASKE